MPSPMILSWVIKIPASPDSRFAKREQTSPDPSDSSPSTAPLHICKKGPRTCRAQQRPILAKSQLFQPTPTSTSSMPPHRGTRVNTTNPEALRLTEAMAKYSLLMETCAQCIRTLPNRSLLYKEALEEWRHRSEFYRPPRGNEAARARFFSAVEKTYKIESRAPKDCYLIIFACSAAVQAVIEQDFLKLCESDRCYVLSESQRLAVEQVKANIVLPPATKQLPHHLKSAFFPETRPKQAFEELIGKQVSYRDPKTSKTRECMVTDHITSHIRGTFYVITDTSDEQWEEQVNENEMHDMLDRAVQQS